MKRIELCFIMIMLFSILCGCASPSYDKNDDSSSLNFTESIYSSQTESPLETSKLPNNNPDRLPIEYGRYYSVNDEEYKKIENLIYDDVYSTICEMNKGFATDVAEGRIPEVLYYDYYGTVIELKLVSEKYSYEGQSYVCPCVKYSDGTGLIEMTVDAETLGERRRFITCYSLAERNRDETEKTTDEIITIAINYLIEKTNIDLENDDYTITETIKLGQSSYSVNFILNSRFIQNASMGFIHINPDGYYTTVFIDADMICEIEKLATHLSPIDENELLEQANQTFREAKCDCALSLAYRLYVSEYKGEKYAVLSCLIRPDNKNPEDHHHDYVNNQFNVFLKLND